jgi:protein-tyrosine phosphatase
MVRHLLVVCTANVCRSAVAERMLARELAGRRDVDGHEWIVRSAGTADLRAPMDRNTIAAAAAIGLDLGDHRARHLTKEILATDGADLVLTMTREHLRHVVGMDPSAWPRTFTLKEFARRADAIRPAAVESGGVAEWLERVRADRRAADLMRPDPSDDIADPYGAPRREHDLMLTGVRGPVVVLARQLGLSTG